MKKFSEFFNEQNKNPKDLMSRHKYVTKEFQDYGYRLATKLGDLTRVSMYIKLAKDKPRSILDIAYSFAIDYPNAKNRTRLFMWKVKELEKEYGSPKEQLLKEKEKFYNEEYKAELIGNIESKKLIIFSHGFGVDKYSNGLFTDISKQLLENYACLFFWYCKQKSETVVESPSQKDMGSIVKELYEFYTKRYVFNEISIIAHSLGCTVIKTLNRKNIKNMILISPQVKNRYKPFIERYKSRYPDFDEKKDNYLPRTDGTKTLIHPEFLLELKKNKPVDVLLKLRAENKVFIQALDDEIIKDDFSVLEEKGMRVIKLNGSHNFEDKNNRKILIAIINKEL